MTSQDWWSRKMASPQARPSTPPVRPPAPPYPMTARPVSVPVRYDRAGESSTRAQSQALADRCPDCSSSNYFSATRETRPRCFDCGYPIVQSTSGLQGTASDGPVHKSRQVSTANNFNPGEIVGRIE